MSQGRNPTDGAVINKATITYRAITYIPEDLKSQLVLAGLEKDIETIEEIERILRESPAYAVTVTRPLLSR